MAYFYEIRSADDHILKRNGGFADPEAAKNAALADAKQMRTNPQPGKPAVGRILIGRNLEIPTR
jgi:hypothetical protein